MKIVYLCEFSAGVCGVWNRVYNVAKRLAKKHEVFVLSSNVTKGSKKKAKSFEELEGIKIYRFPVYFRLGENALFWDYRKKLEALKPDIVHAHVFRHPHSTTAPKIAKKLGAKCFLTTHAPFVERELRDRVLNTAVTLYDSLFAKQTLNSYDKVITITKWEISFLRKLGCKSQKILYIPNGFPEEFLKQKIRFSSKKQKTIVFLGRIAPIKNLGSLISAFKQLLAKDHNVRLKLIGPIERGYELPLIRMIKALQLNKKVEFTGPIMNLERKIKALTDSDIFVLPSKREASPQVLIEAMALGMPVISSTTQGGKEFVKDGENGFLFLDKDELFEKLEYCLKNPKKLKKLKREARKSVQELTWKDLAAREDGLYKKP